MSDLNGTSPALPLLQSLWAERPRRTVKMNPRGTPKYQALARYPDGRIAPGAEYTIDRKTGERIGDGDPVVITDAMLAEHLQGKATYGCPLIGADGLARALVIELDADSESGACQVLDAAAAAGLFAWAIACPGSDGHDGSHTWILYDQEWSPERLQEQSRQILRAAGLPEKEVYPGKANIRLPFGFHVHSKRRGVLLLQDGQCFDLDAHDGLVAAIGAVRALPRNTTPPPPAPERAQALMSSSKVRSAGDITPLDDYDARATRDDVEQLLSEAGWSEERCRGSVGYWRRPGKSKGEGHSATLGHVADTVLSVFSEGDPDLPGESGRGKHYGPAKVYTHLKHDKDFSAAAKDLYAKGYGTRISEPALPIIKPAPDVDTPRLSRKFLFTCLDEGEAGDARLLEALYQGKLCYDYAAGVWYIFGSHAWARCDGPPRRVVWSKVASAYLDLAAAVTADSEKEVDDAKKKAWADALIERAKKLRSLNRINNVLTLAQELLKIKGDEWDADPWLLGVPNGVLELRTGELRDGRPEDYIRTVAPTEWQGIDAPCVRWERFVNEVMSDEDSRVTFLQRLMGYTLNGTTQEHVLVLLVGRGRNGKRVLCETVQAVIGNYAGTVSTDIVIGQTHRRTAGSAQPHLMDLQGKRLVVTSETSEYDHMSTAQVKNITGGDRIKARQLYGKPIEFSPTHTLFLQTNHKPQAPADDDAIWDRVRIIEFKERFVEDPDPKKPNEHPRDPALEETLQSEASGILAWLVRGGLDWLSGGLRTPESVKQARDTYRKEESIADFLDAACIEAEGLSAEGGALYAAYESWCKASKLRTKSPVWFGKQLQQRFEKGRTSSGRTCYYGLGLETTEFQPSSADNPVDSPTTLQNSLNPSEATRVPINDDLDSSSEGLRSIGKTFEVNATHEDEFMHNPSDPSDPSEFRAEVVPPSHQDLVQANHARQALQRSDIESARGYLLWIHDASLKATLEAEIDQADIQSEEVPS